MSALDRSLHGPPDAGDPVRRRHSKAARALNEALVAGDAASTHRAVETWRGTLDARERMQTAVLALAACEPADLRVILDRLEGAGQPLVPSLLGDIAEDAAQWARWASTAELRAFAAAAAWRLSAADRRLLAAALAGAHHAR